MIFCTNMELVILIVSLILIAAAIGGKGSVNQFDSANTMSLRGILAVMIVIAHIVQNIDIQRFTPPYHDYVLREAALQITGSAIYVVAMFFCLSAYGLMVSYRIKGEAYLRGFFSKRCQRLLIPLCLVVIVFQIYNGFMGTFNPKAIIEGLINGGTINLCPNTWFVFSIFIFYLMFWAVARTFRNIMKIAVVLTILTVAYTAALFLLFYFKGWGLHWFQSNLGFVAGIWLCCFERHLSRAMNHHMTLITILLICTLTSLWLSVRIHWVAITIACGTVPLLVYCIICRLPSVRNRFLGYLGKYSYEIYITHGVLIVMFSSIQSPILFTLLVIATVMPFSIIVNYISNRIQRSAIIKK